jgi:hypothetical protein
MKRPDLARKQRQHHSKVKSQAAAGERNAETPKDRRERLRSIREGR